MSKILQNSPWDHIALRPLFCLFLRGHIRQVSLYLLLQTERSEYVRRRLLEGSLDEKNNEFHVGSAEYLKMLMPLLNEEQM